MTYIPILEKVLQVNREAGPVAECWYEVTSPAQAEGLELSGGDWIVIVARVYSVKRDGGYPAGGLPPGAAPTPVKFASTLDLVPAPRAWKERARVSFRLSQAEIYLHSPGTSVIPVLRGEKEQVTP